MKPTMTAIRGRGTRVPPEAAREQPVRARSAATTNVPVTTAAVIVCAYSHSAHGLSRYLEKLR